MINPIGKSNIVRTPESMEDLENHLTRSYSGENKAAAFVAMMMTWNLAHEYVEDSIATDLSIEDDLSEFRSRAKKLIKDDLDSVLEGLKVCGDFALNLIPLLQSADSYNRRRIGDAFPDLIVKAHRHAAAN